MSNHSVQKMVINGEGVEREDGNKQHPIDTKKNDKDEETKRSDTTVADIIGEFGLYQLSITLLTLIRYICVAMMTNTGPLIAPSVEHWCQLPTDNSTAALILKPNNITIDEYLKNKCQLNLIDGTIFECSSWSYNTTQNGVTLTDSFNLVCARDWLRSSFQSIVSVGVVVASIVWGSFSDRHGRLYAIRVCFICSLISGIVSYFAKNFLVYTISRSLCSFGDLGLVVSLSTIIVELLGNKYRGAVCLIVYTGWAFGVMIMPWLTDYFKDYRQLMLFTIMCHIFTLPWLLTVGESVRWSLVDGKISEAGEELRRISTWNRKGDKVSLDEVDKKFDNLKQRFVIIAERRKLEREKEEASSGDNRLRMAFLSIFGGLSKVNQLFLSKELAITTLTLVWVNFNSELLYMLFIMINSDIGDNIKLNYAIGGVMETLATIIAIVIISGVTRKLSLVSTLTSISCLCFVLAFTHQYPSASVWILNITKLAVSTLSSLMYVTMTESFPTNLRQTGFGVAGTIGSFGAVVAPFIRTELVDIIGMTNVMLILVLFPLTAATVIPFFLRETKGVELPDDVDEIGSENFDQTLRRRGSSISKRASIMTLGDRV